MKIIISPAKTMIQSDVKGSTTPLYLENAKKIIESLKELDLTSLNKIYKVSESLLLKEKEKLDNSDFNITSSAITSYDGIQYKYLDYNSLDNDAKEYIDKYLNILSGLYGVLKPTDGIINYRLEMNSNKKFYKEILRDYYKDEDYVINLASKEYSSILDDDNLITIRFLEYTNSVLKEKSTSSKIMRGLFLRYLAINNIKDINELKNIKINNFVYSEDNSTDKILTFIKA